MTVLLNPYLSFKTEARDAMAFYHEVLGGELTLSRFGDINPEEPEASRDLVMHAMLKAPNGMVLMASDTPPHMELRPPAGISISLSGPRADGEEMRRYWTGLGAGGHVVLALEAAPWGDEFGMLVDRFGITWMVNIAGK